MLTMVVGGKAARLAGKPGAAESRAALSDMYFSQVHSQTQSRVRPDRPRSVQTEKTDD